MTEKAVASRIALEAPDEDDEQRMIANVASCRGEVLQALHGVLERDNSLSRCCAAKALGRLGACDPESAQRLVGLLQDPDPDVRMDAAAVLGRLRIADTAAPLLQSLESDLEGEVRIEAVKALAALRSPETTEPLLRCVREDGYPELDHSGDDLEYSACWEVQSQALDALGAIGDPRATEPLIDFLSNEEYADHQENGYRVLARLDDDRAREFLQEQLKHGAALARRRAARALAVLPGLEGRALPPVLLNNLTNALLDTDPDVRIYAARALAGSGNPQVAVPLTLLLRDPEAEVRGEVVSLLGKMRGPDVVERLHRLLSESDPKLRRRVAGVLGEIGDPASLAILSALLEDDDPDLVYEVLGSLGSLAVSGPQHAVARILADPDTHAGVRVQAARVLGILLANEVAADRAGDRTEPLPDSGEAEAARESVDPEQVLERCVLDTDAGVRHAALQALLGIKPEQAADRLVGVLRGSSGATGVVPENAAMAETSGAPAANEDAVREQEVPESLRDLATRDPATSTLASILDAQLGAKEEMASPPEPVSQAPLDTAADALRILAARLLGGVADPGSTALDALIEATRDGAAELRKEALASLGRIGDEHALPAVLDGLDAEQADVRLAALDALGGFHSESIADARLAELIRDPDPLMRQRVLRTLATHTGVTANECVLHGLEDEARDVCSAALAVLSQGVYSDAVRERVIELMFAFSAELRTQAAAALRRLDDGAAATRLLAILADLGQEEVHWICIEALAEMLAEESQQPPEHGLAM